MTRPGMFTRLRPAAIAIAAEWRIPGMDPDDVRQEALLALWIATSKHDPERGPWSPFARVAVKARMRDLLQAATRQKRTAELVHNVDVAAPDIDPGREQLTLLVDNVSTLTELERSALANHLNGTTATSTKAHETALYRARRKLRPDQAGAEAPAPLTEARGH